MSISVRALRRCIGAVATLTGATVLTILPATESYAADIDYVIQQANCEAKPCLHVTLSFVSAPDGVTRLRLPGDYAGTSGAASRLSALRTDGRSALLIPAIGGEAKVLATAGERVTVQYELHGAKPSDAVVSLSDVYLPFIETDRARLLGWTALVIPMLSSRAARTVSMTFLSSTGAPLSAYSNMGAVASRVEVAWHPTTIGTSIILLGNYVSHLPRERRVMGQTTPADLVVAGNEPSARDFRALADDLTTVYSAITKFWGDHASEAPLVYFGEVRDTRSSLKGAAFGSAFLTFATPDRTRDDLLYLWMHELNHAWLPQKMYRKYGGRATGLYWFSEGFTEFVTHRLFEDSGIKPAGHLFRELAKARQRLAVATLPERYESLLSRFHSDAAANRQVYDRGLLLAARWDAQIRCQSGDSRSLRDALQSLLVVEERGQTALDVQAIELALTQAGVGDFSGDLERFVEQGEVPRVEDLRTLPCRKLRPESAGAR